MNALWNWISGVVIVAVVVLVLVALSISALVDGEDWDDDAGKGE